MVVPALSDINKYDRPYFPSNGIPLTFLNRIIQYDYLRSIPSCSIVRVRRTRLSFLTKEFVALVLFSSSSTRASEFLCKQRKSRLLTACPVPTPVNIVPRLRSFYLQFMSSPRIAFYASRLCPCCFAHNRRSDLSHLKYQPPCTHIVTFVLFFSARFNLKFSYLLSPIHDYSRIGVYLRLEEMLHCC